MAVDGWERGAGVGVGVEVGGGSWDVGKGGRGCGLIKVM